MELDYYTAGGPDDLPRELRRFHAVYVQVVRRLSPLATSARVSTNARIRIALRELLDRSNAESFPADCGGIDS
jgi:hypothetical protein